MSTTTSARAERKAPPWRQAEQTLQARIHAAREAYPGLREARLAVIDLRIEEQGLVAKLQAPPAMEDPHAHDAIRTQLAAVREKLAASQQAERASELAASQSAMTEFVPEHLSVSAAFVESLEALLIAHERMTELRDLAMGLRLPLSTKTPFYGLDQLMAIRGQLKHIKLLWAQG